jgi:hypothetical protein
MWYPKFRDALELKKNERKQPKHMQKHGNQQDPQWHPKFPDLPELRGKMNQKNLNTHKNIEISTGPSGIQKFRMLRAWQEN